MSILQKKVICQNIKIIPKLVTLRDYTIGRLVRDVYNGAEKHEADKARKRH